MDFNEFLALRFAFGYILRHLFGRQSPDPRRSGWRSPRSSGRSSTTSRASWRRTATRRATRRSRTISATTRWPRSTSTSPIWRQKGFLRKNYNKSRSLEVVRADLHAPALELPLMGAVAAGLPIEAIAEQETITVPHDMVRRGNNYVLRGARRLHDRRADPRRRLHHRQLAADGGERRDGGGAGGGRRNGRRLGHGQEVLPRERAAACGCSPRIRRCSPCTIPGIRCRSRGSSSA